MTTTTTTTTATAATSTISPLRQRMLEDMASRQLAKGTQIGHIRACKRFTVWLKRSPDSTTVDEVRLFQLHLMQTGTSIQTRNRTMTGLRFLFRVTMRRLDLANEIHHIKEPTRIPQILSGEEAARLLAMASHLQTRVLLSIGYGAGLRVSEVVRLKVKHIDASLGIIRVEQGKGRKDRHVMLSPELLALLREWWRVRSTHNDEGVPLAERWLFPGRGDRTHLTARQVTRLFKQALDAASIKKTVTLHALRHSFATHLFDRGTDIRTIQALLGHEKLETTARYTRVATGLITAVESPLDQLDMPHSAKAAKRPGRAKTSAGKTKRVRKIAP
jgi:integrase/recombinase XerD